MQEKMWWYIYRNWIINLIYTATVLKKGKDESLITLRIHCIFFSKQQPCDRLILGTSFTLWLLNHSIWSNRGFKARFLKQVPSTITAWTPETTNTVLKSLTSSNAFYQIITNQLAPRWARGFQGQWVGGSGAAVLFAPVCTPASVTVPCGLGGRTVGRSILLPVVQPLRQWEPGCRSVPVQWEQRGLGSDRELGCSICEEDNNQLWVYRMDGWMLAMVMLPSFSIIRCYKCINGRR